MKFAAAAAAAVEGFHGGQEAVLRVVVVVAPVVTADRCLRLILEKITALSLVRAVLQAQPAVQVPLAHL